MNNTLLEFPYAGLSIDVVDEFTEKFMIYPTFGTRSMLSRRTYFGQNQMYSIYFD